MSPRRYRLHLHGVRELDLAESAAVEVVVLDTLAGADRRGPLFWDLTDAAMLKLYEACDFNAATAVEIIEWARLQLHVETEGLGWIEAVEGDEAP